MARGRGGVRAGDGGGGVLGFGGLVEGSGVWG